MLRGDLRHTVADDHLAVRGTSRAGRVAGACLGVAGRPRRPYTTSMRLKPVATARHPSAEPPMSADKRGRGNEQLALAPISFPSQPGTSPRHLQVRGRAP